MAESAPAERRMLVWRHGQTTWNVQRRFQGQADAPLDDIGRAQARFAANYLAAEKPDALVSSDLSRAYDTANELSLLTGLDIQQDARLREASLGHWQGLTHSEVQDKFPTEYAEWLAGKQVDRGGETKAEVAARAMTLIDEIMAKTDLQTIVLVTHSAAAIALTGQILDFPQPLWKTIVPLANCHWSELRLGRNGWRLWSHNVGAVAPRIPAVPAEVAAAEPTAGEASDAEAFA